MSIPYTESYIRDILVKAETTLSILAFNHSQAKAMGMKADCYWSKYQEMYLYFQTLSNYVYGGEDNCITDDERGAIIEGIIHLCSCNECNDFSDSFNNCLTDENFCLLLEDNGFTVPLG